MTSTTAIPAMAVPHAIRPPAIADKSGPASCPLRRATPGRRDFSRVHKGVEFVIGHLSTRCSCNEAQNKPFTGPMTMIICANRDTPLEAPSGRNFRSYAGLKMATTLALAGSNTTSTGRPRPVSVIEFIWSVASPAARIRSLSFFLSAAGK